MKRSIIFALAGLAVTGGALALFVVPSARSSVQVAPTPEPTATALPRFPSAELAELDRVVQARFAVVPRDGRFGYGRIAGFVSEEPVFIHGQFSPVSKTEIAAVAALVKNHQDVVFSLIGRKHSAARSPGTPRVQGPLVLTSPLVGSYIGVAAATLKASHQTFQQAERELQIIAKNAPSPQELMPLAEGVLAKTNPDEGAQAQIGEWHIVARPVPASGPQCLSCHNNMAKAAAKATKGVQPELVSLGDPLAVALYAVRSVPDAQPAVQQAQRSSP